MPDGKPAGVRCVQLTDDMRCKLWGSDERPDVCQKFKAEPDICGSSAAQAFEILTLLSSDGDASLG